ncbi:MAG: GDP-mannose 4,6-dehydratase [Rhizobiaceae bacterium]
MTILVTGASGFVGRRLAAALAAERPGETLVCWGHEPDGGLVAQGARWRSVDLTDAAAADRAIREDRPDRVFHLAALSSVGQAHVEAGATYDANVGGTLNLAKSIAAHAPGARIVFASTGEVYGRAFLDGVVTEATRPEPGNAYARSKLAAEFILRDVLAPVGSVVALRLLNHTGPAQDERFVVPAFAAQVARIEAGKSPPSLSVGNLDAERDFIDADDAVDAYLKTLEMDGPDSGYAVYNVASGRPRRIASIVDRLQALSSVPFAVEIDPARLRPSDIPRTECDTSAFRVRTGWAPERDFDDTIAAVLDWWREQVQR